MAFNCGIVGLPNVGKSTLFNAVTAAGAEASNYPFCTIDPNVGVVPVPDARIEVLAEIYRPQKVVPATMEFVDIAGLVKGASTGEGLGNQFLSHIRDVDAILHVVRCFDDPHVVHVDGSVNPRRDIDVVQTELLLKDLETVERKCAEIERRARTGDRKLKAEAGLYARVREHLASARPGRSCEGKDHDETLWKQGLHLLTDKPVLYVCNVGEREQEAGNRYVQTVSAVAAEEGARVVRVCAAVEAELAELPPAERKEFLSDLGWNESGLTKVIHEGYALLRLLTFFTAGEKEVHAWTLPQGSTAVEAAGKVHTDFAKGFIRAEVAKFADLERLGSEQAIRDAGLLHVEGREYRVDDGDVVFIRFNV